jgi:hypothetical protein
VLEEREAEMTTKTVSMTKPCAKCPFRDGDWLRRERRSEIARGLLNDEWFACHATVDYGEGEGPEGGEEEWWDEPDGQITDRSKECAGAIVVSERSGFSSQYRRIMVRLGAASGEIDGSGIPWQSLNEWVNQGEDDEESEGEPCSVVNEGCEAPAGYMTANGVAHGTEFAENECEGCGEPVCDNCLGENGMCDYCNEDEL